MINNGYTYKYNGYPRLIELNDNSLLTVYESNGNVLVKKSEDYGNSWSSAVTVAAFKKGVNMAIPDVIHMEDNSILVSYNPRPTGNAISSEKFTIRTVKSYDGGITWKGDQLVYEASNDFRDGVWEPSTVQLPSGKIQLFFSNETSMSARDTQGDDYWSQNRKLALKNESYGNNRSKHSGVRAACGKGLLDRRTQKSNRGNDKGHWH